MPPLAFDQRLRVLTYYRDVIGNDRVVGSAQACRNSLHRFVGERNSRRCGNFAIRILLKLGTFQFDSVAAYAGNGQRCCATGDVHVTGEF